MAGGRDELGGGLRESAGRTAARDEVAGERDQIGLDLGCPPGAAAQQREPRAIARVHVRDVHHRQPVEVARQAREREVAYALAQRQRFRSGGRHTDRRRRDHGPFQAHHRWV